MTDITERLRQSQHSHLSQSCAVEAAYTIETLRQRVAELEADNGLTIAYMSGFHDGKKDALKQGEPVAWGLLMPNGNLDSELVGSKEDCEFWTRADGERQTGWVITPLYTAPQVQQGEPVATVEETRIVEHINLPTGTDLYTAAPTCFSAGDMADAQAKAAQVEREECAKVLDDVGARLQTDNEPDEFWRGVGATVEACEIAIRMRGKEMK